MCSDISKNLTTITERQLCGTPKWRGKAGELFLGGWGGEGSRICLPLLLQRFKGSVTVIPDSELYPLDEVVSLQYFQKVTSISTFFLRYFHPQLLGRWKTEAWNDKMLCTGLPSKSASQLTVLLTLGSDFMIINNKSVPCRRNFGHKQKPSCQPSQV